MTEPVRFEQLIDWLEGRLDPETDAAVTAEVARGDARTRATVDWLRSFLAVGRLLPLHEPPPSVRQNLRRQFSAWRADRSTADVEPIELVATLLFDSDRDLVVGRRAVDTSDDARHIAYTSDRADIVLDVHRLAESLVDIEGQVLPVEPTSAPVFEATVHGPGVELRAISGDELGRFALANVPDAVTRLRVTNGEFVLTAAIDVAGRPR